MCVCVYVYVCVRVCVRARACVRACVRAVSAAEISMALHNEMTHRSSVLLTEIRSYLTTFKPPHNFISCNPRSFSGY
jgi:hypothetical protein